MDLFVVSKVGDVTGGVAGMIARGASILQEFLPLGLRRGEGHLQLEHGLRTVREDVLDLARVNPDHAQQQVAGHAERQGHSGIDNRVDALRNIRGEDLGTSELLVAPVGRQPYFGEGALFGKDHLRVKHDERLD